MQQVSSRHRLGEQVVHLGIMMDTRGASVWGRLQGLLQEISWVMSAVLVKAM
jgi:hypothetical protein